MVVFRSELTRGVRDSHGESGLPSKRISSQTSTVDAISESSHGCFDSMACNASENRPCSDSEPPAAGTAAAAARPLRALASTEVRPQGNRTVGSLADGEVDAKRGLRGTGVAGVAEGGGRNESGATRWLNPEVWLVKLLRAVHVNILEDP